MPTQYTTPDYNQERLTQLKNLFSDLFTAEGQLDKAELAKLALLNDPHQLTTHDRYSFAWSGKTLAKQHAFAPSLATLTHDKERSYTPNSHSQIKATSSDAENSPSLEGVAPQGDGVVSTTQNLFQKNKDSKPHIIIEGENLEVLKQLQSAYYEQIKCIYIDPPYNTGKDFVYSDNFTQDRRAYWQESGQTDEYSVKITTNTESSGRYHSDWLSMIYSRLLLARQLLTDDGVIFVSIDDNEVHNLRKVMDEVFGEEGFVSQMIWKRRTGSNDSLNFASNDHEYVLVYFKNPESQLNGLGKTFENYKNPDNDSRGDWMADNLTCNKTASERPNLFYQLTDPQTGLVFECNPNRVWAYEKSTMEKHLSENKIIFPKSGKGTPLYKRFRAELKSEIKPFSSIIDTKINSDATKELRELMGGHYFDFPKGVDLIKQIILQGMDNSSIILDFFAGSGTTGQAVMELNEADGGNRQCILVQMPELTDERSEAYKAGYKRISDITIERNKRVIQGYGKTPKALNAGFEVFRLEQSNFPVNQWRPDPELDDDQNVVEFEKYVLAKEASLFSELDPTKAVLEIAIKEGLKLDYTQTILKDFANNQVLQLSDDSRTILVCVDPKVELATVELLAKNYKESKFICLERAIDTTTKWNLNHNLGAGFKAV